MKSIVLGIAILVVTTLSSAQDEKLTVESVTSQMQKRFESLKDARASFTQRVKFGFSRIEQTFKGSLTLKKPNKYRIESDNQTIVTDGTTVWAYSPANRQVVIDHYKENQNSVSPDRFLIDLPETYYISLVGTEHVGSETLITLKLIPRDDRSFIKSVRISVVQSLWNVREIEIVDLNETETTYHITNLETNVGVEDSNFVFTPPSGTEIVDLR